MSLVTSEIRQDRTLRYCRFQLASFQLDTVIGAKTLRDAHQALESLPDTLDNAYDAVWARLAENEDTRTSDIARSAILWVLHSVRPLEPKALTHALAFSAHSLCVSSETTMLDKQAILDIRDVISASHGLLRIVGKHATETVEFSHYSVQSYFDARRRTYFPDAYSSILEAYIDCLLCDFSEFQAFFSELSDDTVFLWKESWGDWSGRCLILADKLGEHPLLSHAALQWARIYHSSSYPQDKMLGILSSRGTIFCLSMSLYFNLRY